MQTNSPYHLFINSRKQNYFEFRRTGSFFSVFLTFFCFVNTLGAQINDTIDYDLSNPYSTITTHLRFLQEFNYLPDISAHAFEQNGVDHEQAVDAAIKLKQVLDGQGIFIEMEDIPKDPDYLDSASNKNRYILTNEYPRIYVQKYDDRWLFSRRSIEEIEIAHKEVFRFGTDKLLKLLPRMGGTKIFGLYMWQVLGILIIVILSVIAQRLITFIIEKLVFGFMQKRGKAKVAEKYVRPVAKPASYLVIFPILILFVPVLQLPVSVGRYIILGLKVLLPIFATIVFYRLVDLLSVYFERLASKTESTLDDQLVPLIRKILKAFVVITGVLFILLNLNISIIPFITGLSIGGLAFALAAQDTIKNFFGSLMIFIDKPFQVGHWITSGEIDGEVEEVGLRSTRVRTFRNSLVYVPNGIIADRTIDNHGLRVYRRFYTTLSITYDTPTRLIRIFVDGLNRIVEEHPHTRKDKYHIFLNDFGASSLNIMFYIFFEAPNWGLELKYRHEVMLSIIELAEKLNVRFAFPTQTLHMETFPGKEGLTPVYGKDLQKMKIDLEDFFKNKR